MKNSHQDYIQLLIQIHIIKNFNKNAFKPLFRKTQEAPIKKKKVIKIGSTLINLPYILICTHIDQQDIQNNVQMDIY